MHRFRCTQVLPLAGNYDIVLFPQGALQVKFKCIICTNNPDFISVFNSNYTSILHCFRYNQLLPLAGNDVISLSPQGGAAGDLRRLILEGRHQLYISVQY